MPETIKNKIEKKDKANIMAILKPYKGLVLFLVLLTLLSNAINLIIPLIISRGIDAYTGGHLIFQKIIIEFSIATVAIFIFSYLQTVVQTFVSERVARDIRSNLSVKISMQSFAYVEKKSSSQLLTNLTSDVEAIKLFVSQAIISIISSLFIIIGASILLITIDWKLALTVLTIIPIIAIAFYIVLKKVKVLFKRSQGVKDWLNRVINESIIGSTLIRVLNAQMPEYNKFVEANVEERNIGITIVRLFATLIPIVSFVASLAMLAVLVLGGHFVISGSMTLGNFAAFNSYIALLIFPIILIGLMSNVIARASASYQRIYSVLQAEDPKDNGTIQKELTGSIHVENVTVKYNTNEVLKNIFFDIKPGSKTAILGPTAAGKTQLFYLLTGLIQPDNGSIQFDGNSINDFDKKCFYKHVGFVFQDSIIFNMSLRENIAFSETVSEADLQKAIKTAELNDFVNALPQKLDTVISERGTNLSGGQKQRIMLARALAIHPKILLLDDFTARVDVRTEKQILKNVINNYPNITLLSITQKIESIKDYDQIILLMQGELVAAGTHQTLLQTSTEYMQINQSQRSTSNYELQA